MTVLIVQMANAI